MTQHFLASTLAVALLFTACGGGDSAEAPSENTESPAETPTTDSSAAPPSESGAESASFAQDPCAALDEAEVAAVFGAEASAVSEENAPFYASGNSAACEWTLTHEGLESSVVLWAATQGENAAPDAWADTIAGYIESGRAGWVAPVGARSGGPRRHRTGCALRPPRRGLHQDTNLLVAPGPGLVPADGVELLCRRRRRSARPGGRHPRAAGCGHRRLSCPYASTPGRPRANDRAEVRPPRRPTPWSGASCVRCGDGP